MYSTEKEIRGEFKSIKACLELVLSNSEKILNAFSEAKKVWFIGSGSSYCLAKTAAAMFTMRCALPSFSAAAGDVMLHMQRYSSALENSTIVLISRSGMTSEVLNVFSSVKQLPGVKTVSICANADSTLHTQCDFSLCAPWAFDESVCQTRTIGSFYGCIAMCCAIVSGDTKLQKELFSVCLKEDELNQEILPLAEKTAAWDWDNAVVLGDAEYSGLMDEGALAFKEICCTNSNCYHLLDVRHGPMVMIGKKTLVFSVLENGSDTELALLEDIGKKTGFLLSFGPFERSGEAVCHYTVKGITDPVAYSLIALYILQNIALARAEKRGINPDAPNGLSAWIAL